MGIKISKPTKIFVDNMSVVINAANPASSLNKKAVALAYHFVRQHQAAGVIDIHHIRSEDNYADCLTKPLNSTQLRNLLYEFMSNWKDKQKVETKRIWRWHPYQRSWRDD